jgi:hypothetical protein
MRSAPEDTALRLKRIERLSQRLAEAEEQVATAAISWALFGWLWLLGGRSELETWADVGDCCTEI